LAGLTLAAGAGATTGGGATAGRAVSVVRAARVACVAGLGCGGVPGGGPLEAGGVGAAVVAARRAWAAGVAWVAWGGGAEGFGPGRFAVFLAAARVRGADGGFGGGVALLVAPEPVPLLLEDSPGGIGGSTRPFEPLAPERVEASVDPSGDPLPPGAGRFGGRGSATVSSRPVLLGRSAMVTVTPLRWMCVGCHCAGLRVRHSDEYPSSIVASTSAFSDS
jgi:hypothetical protein